MKTYGDMSRATDPRVTTQVYPGDDVAYVTANWTRKRTKWILRANQY